MMNISELLNKLDYRISGTAFSRPQYQVQLIIDFLLRLKKGKFNTLLDIGGGYDGRYRKQLENISNKYLNLEISKGKNVDIVGSVYKIPIKIKMQDLITLFMVLEHLNEPLFALKECKKRLKPDGLLVLTTVQYWHTHSYPSDYFRYTRYGLEYLCRQAGLKVISIWSHGGPFLVAFHVVELNLNGIWRVLFSIIFYRLADSLDWIFFKHSDNRKNFDSVGWSLIAINK